MSEHKKVSMLRVWYVEVPDDCPVSNSNCSIGLHRDWVITREDVVLPIKSPWEEYYFPDTVEGLVAAQNKRNELQRRSLWITKQ